MSKQPRPLRIAFLFRWPYNPYLDLLAGALRSSGVQVEIPDRCTWFVSRLRRNGYPHIVHLQEIAPFYLATTLVRTMCKSCVSLAQMWYLKLCGVRIVWTAHDLRTHWERYSWIERVFTRAVAALADAIVTHCEDAKKAIGSRFRVRQLDKIVSMPHGNYVGAYPDNIDRATARKRFGISSDIVTLLSFGLIRPYKGFDNLLDAFFALPEGQAHLIVAGKPFDEPTASRARERLAGHPNVTFVPKFIPDNEIQVFMNASDAVTFAYREILTSGAVILAMSFGKACVAPRLGCIPEVLDPAGGFLYDADSPSTLQDALRQVIAERERLPAMGVYNRAKVEQWPWSQIAAATLNTYRSVLPEGAVVFRPSNGTLKGHEREGQEDN